ncbi:hypothetical protein [Nonomuraea sp. NPDC002799]
MSDETIFAASVGVAWLDLTGFESMSGLSRFGQANGGTVPRASRFLLGPAACLTPRRPIFLSGPVPGMLR